MQQRRRGAAQWISERARGRSESRPVEAQIWLAHEY